MCGIIGYRGSRNATEIVLEGLKKLEYRGYDSWGMFGIPASSGRVKGSKKVREGDKKSEGNEKSEGYEESVPAAGSVLVKKTGRIGLVDSASISRTALAIGHTRWATHGGVTEANAHPHMSSDGSFAVIHNGIVENYQELKEELLAKGYEFKSQTDTEVLVHLIHHLHSQTGDWKKTIKKVFARISGRNAFVIADAMNGMLIAARDGSPLIIGRGSRGNRGIGRSEKKSGQDGRKDKTEGSKGDRAEAEGQEVFVASDIPAFLSHTRDVMYLDDREAVIMDDTITFFSIDTLKEVQKRLVTIDWDAAAADKGEHEYFTHKEIMEQKDTIARAINQDDKKILEVAGSINNSYGTFLVGCGTAAKVCHAGEYLFSKIAQKHVNFSVASEFANYQDFLTPRTLMITISQSGETADVLEAMRVAKKKKVRIISLLNVFGSSMMRQSDVSLLINAGPEKAVASTKATTAQLALVTLIAHACAGKLDEGKRLLIDTASQVNDLLNPRYEEHIRKLAERIYQAKSIFIIGRSVNYPMALESAIKIMEISYIHAQGFAGGELKHGPIALIERGTPTIVLVSEDENKDAILSNATEVKSRGGYIIGVAPENNSVFDYWIRVPDVGMASPIVTIIPVQILAYYLSLLRGNNPDYPRNLAKSVTVM
ncbi:glutamine--fructose-6-phosphate transaminase (isomerizing) [Candidatus Woesearchaeota archaeon CG_4_10_14_0_8_um_filter_47_5]|nr:MAG: glutamine--fructose-6-phosphate transaminase (isomerizing) [Candidatus Woesearchaeota archaeon CG_4_10_14_0_8_um_filter_47_5]